MPRDCRVHLEDILDATRKIQAYTNGFSKTAFLQDDKTFEAVVRNLEIIGEAAKNVPDTVRVDTPLRPCNNVAAGTGSSGALSGTGNAGARYSPQPQSRSRSAVD